MRKDMSRPPQPDAPPTGGRGLRVAYFFTRFPYLTETFLQREVRGMRRLGLVPRIHSFHGDGPPDFEGLPVARFSKWRLLTLFWRIPAEWRRRPILVTAFVRALFTTWPRDWLNHWENLYGAGIAAVLAPEFRRAPVDHIHATWASLPAMTAWVLSALTDIPFSMGAHAYDLFEHEGDWFLAGKCAAARFVHTSTAAGRARLLAIGVPAERVILVRRGLDIFPPCRPLRACRRPLRIVCIARLVEKKGLLRQVVLYRRLREAGFAFSVQILGDGPLRARLEAAIRAHALGGQVVLLGNVSHERVWQELAQADVLVHTGVVASSGDRDGLPNVVPEAMAAGVIVVTAPAEGVCEAVEHGQTGLVCSLDDPAAWSTALERIASDDTFAAGLRERARRWVEEHFDATRNAALILERFRYLERDGSPREAAPVLVVNDLPCSTST